jgi:hypothetical protein
LTGFRSAVSQPLPFHFTNHLVMPSRRYALSVCRRTATGLVRLSNATMAAISSIRLFVVGCGSPP